MAVYFYYGDEDYNIELAIEALKKGLDKNFATVNFKKLYNHFFKVTITYNKWGEPFIEELQVAEDIELDEEDLV